MIPLVVAQITDFHLQNNPDQDYRGFNVEQHLDRVVDDLLLQTPAVDMIICSGDLVHHGGPEGYQRLSRRLARLPVPSYWIPGNHDDAQLMLKSGDQQGGQLNQRSVVAQGWAIILLDSTASPDGQGGGSLSSTELAFLEQQLQQYSTHHCLVVLHHNPLPVGSNWQDQIMLANADQFWAVLGQHHSVRAVINGHVHQASDQLRGEVRVIMTPATSVQFKAGCQQMVLEDDPVLRQPAYRLLTLHRDGQIETSIKRVEG
ncbi:Icc protein [Amphritea atlantica]|uniref:Icc protein n=1 Tax=Amphritea atlantica TaxID=355243 RepID=A0A1H9LXA5_9GAMM|nr:phosphodiesterase [Amphritea atlantica]SER16054.1 Icc protein [Amphritea atlantica]